LSKEDLITIAIQVNGKLRADINIAANSVKEDILSSAKENERIKSYIDGKEIIKEIYVPGRLVNFVIK
jgi:leucyl-tRNA synthetase